MKYIFIILIMSFKTFAQKYTFGTSFGKSFFTSGDLLGNSFGLNIEKKINKNIFFNIEFQRGQSQLKKDEIVPNYISLMDQISSSRILIGPSIELFNSTLGISTTLGYQSNKVFKNGGIRYLNDPKSGGLPGYYMESGNYLIKKNVVFKPSIFLKIINIKTFYIAPEIGLIKGNQYLDWIANIKFNYKVL
jgi:hypothetical protein